jgi:acetyltransferase-like isoleucine patch superfamily enzyme
VAGIAAAVTKDVAPYSIVMGNPARRIGPARKQ